MKYINTLNDSIVFIEDNLKNEITVNDVAKHVKMSENDFQKLFTFIVETPVMEYVRNRRLYLAAIDIIQTEMLIGDIGASYTYYNHSSFTRAFTAFHGISPTELRNNRQAQIIVYKKYQVERKTEMDFRVIELPKTRMARSGKHSLKSFDKWWSEKYNKTHNLYPKDFIWNNQLTKKLEWIYVLEENEDSGKFETFLFPGGLYATITTKDTSKDKSDGYYKLLSQIKESSEYQVLTDQNKDYHQRYPMGHVSTPQDFKEHQFTIYIPIIKNEG